jgi:hypothetical protein
MTNETTPLRFLLKTLAGAVGVLGLMIGVTVLVSPARKPPLAGLVMTSLGDGSFVSVPTVTVGTSHHWLPPRERTLWDWFRGTPKPGPLGQSVNPPQLQVWVVRHDGKTSEPKQWPKLRHARLTVGANGAGPDVVGADRGIVFRGENQHPGHPGLAYWSTHTFGLPVPTEHTTLNAGSAATPYVYGFTFPLFPAGCGPLKLELLGEAPGPEQPLPVLATLHLPEPAGLNPPPSWKASPLPATATAGPHALTLKGFRQSGSHSRGNDPYSVRPHFHAELELTSGGQASPVNLFKTGPVVDSAGNTYELGYHNGAGLWFGPHQWTVTAQVPTPEPLRAASTVESPAIDLPADNAVVPLSTTLELRSGRIRGTFVTIGGRGETLQSDPTPAGSVQWGYYGGVNAPGQGASKNFEVSRGTHRHLSSGASVPIELKVKAQLVHVLYSAEGLTKDEWLGVDQVLDDQSRTVPFNDLFHHGTRLVFVDPQPDAKSLRLRFLVRDSAEFTFVIDPPQPEKK